MTTGNFDVWMISLPNSWRQKEVLPSWEGYEVNIFDAITPDTMHLVEEKLNFSDYKVTVLKGKTPFEPTEKASFTSHVLMWKKCADAQRPFLIIEEDVKLGRSIPRWLNTRGLLPIAVKNNRSKTLTPAAAYLVKPFMAKKMYEYFVVRQHRITYNVDHHIKQRTHPHEWTQATARPYAYQIEGESSIARTVK